MIFLGPVEYDARCQLSLRIQCYVRSHFGDKGGVQTRALRSIMRQHSSNSVQERQSKIRNTITRICSMPVGIQPIGDPWFVP